MIKDEIKENKRVVKNKKPTREEAMQAVRTMLAWAGDNPDREGLLETPLRVVKAYEEFLQDTKRIRCHFKQNF